MPRSAREVRYNLAKPEAEAEAGWAQAVRKKVERNRRNGGVGAVGAVGVVGLWGVWGAGCLILERGLGGCQHDVAVGGAWT